MRFFLSRALLGSCMLLATLLLASPGHANPFATAPSVSEPAPASGGFFAPLGRALFTFQREANRRIAEQMHAIRDGKTTGALTTGLLLAFIYGAIHAAGPGHGKLVVMSYFLSREAKIGRGLLMGAQIALAHTLSAVVIVAFADFLLRRTFGGVPAEIPAVRAASYGLIVLIGGLMLLRAVRSVRHVGHDHTEHSHVGHTCGCHQDRQGENGLLSLAIGLVPCTGSVLILLYAFANNILWAGLALVTMIAAGMALAMGSLGLASVLARRLVVSRLAGGGARTLQAVDIAGAALITVMGLVLFVTSF